MAESTWESRELPILEAVNKLYPKHGSNLNSYHVADETGLDRAEVYEAVEALIEDGKLEGNTSINADLAMLLRLRPDGRRAIKQWPTADPYDAFLRALDAAIKDAAPDQRDRLTRLRDATLGIGRDVLVNVLSSVITGRP